MTRHDPQARGAAWFALIPSTGRRALGLLLILPALLLAGGPARGQDSGPDRSPKAAEPAPEDEDGGITDAELEALRRKLEQRRKKLAAEESKLDESLEWLERQANEYDGPEPIGRRERLLIAELKYLNKQRLELLKRSREKPTKELSEAIEKLDEKIETVRIRLGIETGLRLSDLTGLGFVRYESHRTGDFEATRGPSDQRVPLRLHLGATATLANIGRLTLSTTLSKTWDAARAAQRPQDQLDIYAFYADLFVRRTADYEVRALLGRQPLVIGNERLLGSNNFFVFNRSFDAARLHLRTATIQLSLFGGRPVRRRELNDKEANLPDWHESLVGGAAWWLSESERSLAELTLVRKQDSRRRPGEGSVGGSHAITLGLRAFHDFDFGVLVEAEGYGQLGRLGGARQRAAAAAGSLSWRAFHDPIDPERAEALNPRVVDLAKRVELLGLKVGGSWASGDGDPTDGVVETFQPVYGSPHRFNGRADVLGFQNLVDLEAGVFYQFRSDVDEKGFTLMRFDLIVHHFSVAQLEGGVFDVDGRALTPAGSGPRSTSLGWEVDVGATFAGVLAVGYARFFPGRHLRGQGFSEDVEFFYVSLFGDL